MSEYYRVYAEVDLSAVEENVRRLKKLTGPGTKAMAVVKANAYGHGDVAVSKAVCSQVDAYAVATVQEAVNLRENGIEKPILILGYVFPEEYDELIANDIAATVFDYETAKELSDEAVRIGKTALCHIKVDTGMHRIGLAPDTESLEILKEIKKLPGLDLVGIFTHFFASDETEKTSANKQFTTFTDFIRRCRDQGISFKYEHCANSAAIIDMGETDLDMVRMGIAMYGMYPSPDINMDKVDLIPAMTLKSGVVMVKTLPAGEGVSYGATFVTSKETKVATVSVGYGDGYPRRLSNKGQVIIRGKKAPIIGRVCMDQLMVDVSDIPGVERGDVVTLIGRDGDECISVEELAETAGDTFNYEVVCDIGKRIPRRFYANGQWIGNHDNFHEKWNLKI